MSVWRRSSEPSDVPWIMKGDAKASFIKTRSICTWCRAHLRAGAGVRAYSYTSMRVGIRKRHLAPVHLQPVSQVCVFMVRKISSSENFQWRSFGERENGVDGRAATSIWDQAFCLSAFPALASKRPGLFLRLFHAASLTLCQAISDGSWFLDACHLSRVMPETHLEIMLVLNNGNTSLRRIQPWALLIGNLDSL